MLRSSGNYFRGKRGHLIVYASDKVYLNNTPSYDFLSVPGRKYAMCVESRKSNGASVASENYCINGEIGTISSHSYHVNAAIVLSNGYFVGARR